MTRAPDLIERIEALIGPAIVAMGYDLVRVRMIGGARPRLQVMAERPDGTMNVESCADVSHAVSAILDVEDPIDGEYVLEVSSPGIDRPLVRRKDYERYAGFEAKLETAEPIDGRRRFRGRLAGMEADCVRIELAGTDTVAVLPFDAIAEGKLVLTDELVRASLKHAAGLKQDEDVRESEQEPDGRGDRATARGR